MAIDTHKEGFDNSTIMKWILEGQLKLLLEKLNEWSLTAEQISRLIEALNSVNVWTEGVGNKNPKKIPDDGELQKVVESLLENVWIKNKK